MIITSIEIDGFRNLKDVKINPCNGVNVFFGNNAQGKTNLMEAIWLATGEKSFRLGASKEYIAFDRESASVKITFDDGEREQTVEYALRRTPPYKKVYINGIERKKSAELKEHGIKCVEFTPDDLNLTKGSPDVRRYFMDSCLSMLHTGYSHGIAKYERSLTQRNATIKAINAHQLFDEKQLDLWEVQMAYSSNGIIGLRVPYIKRLSDVANGFYRELTDEKENMSLEYLCSVFPDLEQLPKLYEGGENIYLERYRANRENDIAAGFTTLGPHRDDFAIKVDSRLVKEYGSQGQNRSCALCIKLAYASIYSKIKEVQPIMILDDVLSELDAMRQKFILSKIKNMQVFITSCEPIKDISGKFFNVENGTVSEKNSDVLE